MLGFRYYDVAAGRFLTRDPFGFEGGINLYQFSINSPLFGGVKIDPEKLWPEPGKDFDPIAAGVGCAFRVLLQIIKDHGFDFKDPASWCKLLANCVLGGGCYWAVFSLVDIGLGRYFTPWVVLPFAACIAGAYCALLGDLLNYLCNQLDPCKRNLPFPDPCSLLKDEISGCLGGLLPCPLPKTLSRACGFIRGGVSSLLRQLLNSLYDKLCDAI